MELRDLTVTQILLTAVVGGLLIYLVIKRLKDPIRKIPGPRGLPFLGNVLTLNPTNVHNQFYELAKEFGAVMKVKVFTVPIVVLNSREACMEALIKTGTDFQGRPPLARVFRIIQKDVGFTTMNSDHSFLRRTFTKTMKAYGPGVAHLEGIMQDTIQEMTEEINRRGDQVINTADLCSGYVGCVIASMMFGEKYSFDDEVCQMLHKMNKQLIAAADPFTAGVLFDFFPFLLKFKFLFPKTQQTLEDANQVFNDFVKTKTEQFRDSYDPNDKRGCLDYFIEIQQKELDKDGKPLLDNEGVKGLLLDFLNGGLETSQNGLRQMFLDLVTDPTLQRDLQAEIDSQFEPTHKITLKDREMLPQLESYMLESLRYLSQTPFLIPHMTIRDTGVAGYKIPANTIVLMNSFYLAHNPDVYEKPFTLEPKRFLDEDGNLLKSDHPLKENFIGFGAGRRQCPGELFAKSRIFLLLSNILQKYNVELAGELPDHDVRKYPMSILLVPPSVKVHLIQRQQ